MAFTPNILIVLEGKKTHKARMGTRLTVVFSLISFLLFQLPNTGLHGQSQANTARTEPVYDTASLTRLLKQGKELTFKNDTAGIPLLEQALTIATNLKIRAAEVEALTNLGRFYVLMGEGKKGQKYFDQLEKTAIRYKDLKGLAAAKKGLGVSNFNLGFYEVAIKQTEEAFHIYNELNDDENMAKCALNLGIFFSNNGASPNIIKYYKKAEVLFRKAGSKGGVAKAQQSLAAAYYNQKDYLKAIYFLDLAEKAFTNFQDEIELISVAGLRSQILNKQGKFQEAQKLVAQTLKKAKAICPPNVLIQVLQAQTEIAEANKNYKLELSAGIELEELADQIDDLNQKMNGQMSQAFALMQLGQHQKASSILLKHHFLYDSINNKSYLERLNALETHYQIREKDQTINNLEKTKQKQQSILASLSTSLLIQRIMIGCLVTLLLTALFLYYRNKKTQKKLETSQQNLVIRNNELDAINKSKNKLFRIMAHDLRGPIGSLMHLPTIYDNLFQAKDLNAINEMSQVVFRTMKQLHQLLDSLLTWASAESGQLVINPEKLKVELLTNAIQALYSETLVSKEITLKCEVEPGLTLYADNNSVYAILRNLVNNAIKFSYKMQTIIINAIREGDWTRITVEDSGKGMSKALLDSLFQVGESKKSIGTEGEKGTGLGMLIIKEMTALNNGQILIESGFGTGTKVTVWFPAKANMDLSTTRPFIRTEVIPIPVADQPEID